jgi:hypothetical protein
MRVVDSSGRWRARPAVCLLLALATPCGMPTAPASAVVGGVPVAEETVPWFASWWGCGGTLVAPDRVLTAAHCVGGRPLSELESIRVAGTVRRGVRFALTPRWRRRNGRGPLEDVAIVRLDRPITGELRVTLGGPLPQQVKILGRGETGAPEEDLGPEPGRLRGATLRSISDGRCAHAYRKRRGSDGERFHAAQMLCATDIDGLPPLTSACFGDSGGPLYSGPDDAPVLHGIVSWGGAGCGADRLPSVFASVKRVRRFIAARHPRWAPAPDGPVAIAGRPRPGRRLRCVLPSWSVRPTRVRIRWAGWRWGPATVGHRPTYVVQHRDAGRVISCSAWASNAGGSVMVSDGPDSSVPVPRD